VRRSMTGHRCSTRRLSSFLLIPSLSPAGICISAATFSLENQRLIIRAIASGPASMPLANAFSGTRRGAGRARSNPSPPRPVRPRSSRRIWTRPSSRPRAARFLNIIDGKFAQTMEFSIVGNRIRVASNSRGACASAVTSHSRMSASLSPASSWLKECCAAALYEHRSGTKRPKQNSTKLMFLTVSGSGQCVYF